MEGVKINVNSIHAPSLVLGAVVGGAAGAVLGYLLVRNRVRHAADAEVQSVKDHYRVRSEMAKTGELDAGYLAYRAALIRPSTLGYGNPSGDLVGTITRIGDASHIELLDGDGDGDQSDPGTDPGWPGTAEDVRGALEGDTGSGGSEDGVGEIQGNPEGFGGLAEGSFEGRVPADEMRWPPEDRDESKPFRIDADEFNDESYEHYTKISLTYYAGDGVLVDDRDDPIRIFTRVTGPLKVEDFGGVSLDPYIQYVRNHKMESDFDIVLKQTSYADAILNYGNPSGSKGGTRE
jgi:hypothetical protein